MAGCIVDNPDIAGALFPVWMFPMLFTMGFFKNIGQMGVWIKWLSYSTPSQ